jgi:excisionase family DNA binding protein
MSNTIRWLTTQEAADRACCTPRAIRRAVHQARLQAARVRGDFRFLDRWIDEWLMNQVLPDERDFDLAFEVPTLRPAESRWSFEVDYGA